MIVVFSLSIRTRLALPSICSGDVLELDAEVLGDHRAAGQDRDVFEHRLAAIAEARRLDRRDLEAAAQLVDDQGRQRLALDVLGDDERAACRSARPPRAPAASAAARKASSRG